MNNPIIEKFVEVEKEIASEKGDFVLFAVLEREENPGRWDVVAAAPWIGDDKRPAIDYIISKLDRKLSREERGALSMVALLNPTDEFVEMVNRQLTVTDGAPKDVSRTMLGDIYIPEGYVIRSAAAAAPTGRRRGSGKSRAAAGASR